MIAVEIQRDAAARIVAFTAKNHGASEACAAVSLMVLNTVNSIEAFTGQAFTCDYNENGGFIRFTLTEPPEPDATLLLNAMWLGLTAVQQSYEQEITLREIEPA